MGPEGFQESLVYLRTAVSVDPEGLGQVRLRQDAGLPLGHSAGAAGGGPQDSVRRSTIGEPAWQEVPGEYRAMLRRLIVIQGDTEPASVEQQRHLGKTAPSLYDMRNLFQVNVEEGRHLWAMVYLLHKYFGRDGREEAEDLLRRRSGSADAPRMLGAFNEATPDWLSLFMFTFFTDRDGKMQLESLAQSGFDPLSRTCRFMLTEEAHHMFVGETGIGRIVQRTCEAMKAAGIEDPNDDREGARARRDRPADHPEEAQPALLAVARPVRLGGLDQRRQRLQRRPQGPLPRDLDRRRPPAGEATPIRCSSWSTARSSCVDEPALTALNMRLRDDYTRDCAKGIERFNKIIERTGVELPAGAAARGVPPPDRRVQATCRRRPRAS